MTLGEKIKQKRLELGLTQEQVAGTKITRNMLSSIENGKAFPSRDTLKYLSEELMLPLGYLADDNAELSTSIKDHFIPEVVRLYKEKKYLEAYSLYEKNLLDLSDPLLVNMFLEIEVKVAEQYANGGSVHNALKHIENIHAYASKSIFPVHHILAKAELIYAMAATPIKPAYSLQKEKYIQEVMLASDDETYHYIQEDDTYPYTKEEYIYHMKAKKLMKDHHYVEATIILEKLIEDRFSYSLSVLTTYRIYSDLEICYRERKDFEKAYKCSKKASNLAESFHK